MIDRAFEGLVGVRKVELVDRGIGKSPIVNQVGRPELQITREEPKQPEPQRQVIVAEDQLRVTTTTTIIGDNEDDQRFAGPPTTQSTRTEKSASSAQNQPSTSRGTGSYRGQPFIHLGRCARHQVVRTVTEEPAVLKSRVNRQFLRDNPDLLRQLKRQRPAVEVELEVHAPTDGIE